ncbi:MAG: polysaccharide deacetylase family protein [Desulfomonile tiedjei]|nr:polysaccharide deacetylase family protein [Desulfomonile tiedjei]
MHSLESRSVALDKAVFVISLDTELAWGSFDRDGLRAYERYYSQVRSVVERLLVLFQRYGIRATWALVGHLFLRSCSRDGADSHSHVLQPSYSWYPQGWLSQDPYSSVETDPFFYAPDVVEMILGSGKNHEIASHTFTHAILGDPECSRDVALSQLRESGRLAREKGLELTSLVFPRNSIGHLDVLCELGYVSFRGLERNWFRKLNSTPIAGRFCRYFDKLMAFTPPCYKEFTCYRKTAVQRWLFDLPASMFYPPFGGLWNLVGLSRRVEQAKKGVAQAVRNKALFHLWFHPFNLASSPLLFEGLEEVLASIDDQVQAGNLESLTMTETALYLNSRLEPDT